MCLAPLGARAQSSPSDLAAAQTLFDEGKRLMEAHDYEHACPKFEESERLEPRHVGRDDDAEGSSAPARADARSAPWPRRRRLAPPPHLEGRVPVRDGMGARGWSAGSDAPSDASPGGAQRAVSETAALWSSTPKPRRPGKTRALIATAVVATAVGVAVIAVPRLVGSTTKGAAAANVTTAVTATTATAATEAATATPTPMPSTPATATETAGGSASTAAVQDAGGPRTVASARATPAPPRIGSGPAAAAAPAAPAKSPSDLINERY